MEWRWEAIGIACFRLQDGDSLSIWATPFCVFEDRDLLLTLPGTPEIHRDIGCSSLMERDDNYWGVFLKRRPRLRPALSGYQS